MDKHTIRTATLNDSRCIAHLFDCYRIFYNQPSDPVLAESFIRDRIDRKESVIFIYETALGEIVGFTQLYPIFSSVSAARAWILNDLFVHDSYRRKGVGRALLKSALEFSRESGARFVSLETGILNHDAQRLYESIGFERQTDIFLYCYASDKCKTT